jgi:hypothetical protein
MKKAGRESAFHVSQPKMSRYPLFGAEPVWHVSNLPVTPKITLKVEGHSTASTY